MEKEHQYKATITWTGNLGNGTLDYRSYERNHIISVEEKTVIQGSSDPAFRGDKNKHNPEDLFISALSSCHMLWYLHFCSEEGIIVTEYVDEVTGKMTEKKNGSGFFTEVTLNPVVKVLQESMVKTALLLHKKANEYCFIANSVNFPIIHKPTVLIQT